MSILEIIICIAKKHDQKDVKSRNKQTIWVYVLVLDTTRELDQRWEFIKERFQEKNKKENKFSPQIDLEYNR